MQILEVKQVNDALAEMAEYLSAKFPVYVVLVDGEYAGYVHPNNHRMIEFLRKRGYTVLNLTEIRKP